MTPSPVSPGSSSTAVLLDIDGTVLDSTYHHAVAWKRALDSIVPEASRGIPLWRVHRTVGMGGDKLVPEVAGEAVERDHGDDLRARWREEYLELRAEVGALPGAAELVRSLAQQGHRVAFASSGDPQFAREAVEVLGVGDQVEVLTSSADVDASKPEPHLILETLARMPGVERAVMVGDTPYDVTSAERAGLRCLTLRSGGFGEDELREAGAALVAAVPGDVLDIDLEEYLSPVQR